MRVKLDWQASGYDAATHVSMIESACKGSDAVVITVPFVSTSSESTAAIRTALAQTHAHALACARFRRRYKLVDAAINECVDAGITVVTGEPHPSLVRV